MNNIGWIASCADCVFSVQRGNRKFCVNEKSEKYHKNVNYKNGCTNGKHQRIIHCDDKYYSNSDINGFEFSIVSKNRECVREVYRRITLTDRYCKDVENETQKFEEANCFLKFIQKEIPDVYRKLLKNFRTNMEGRDD